MKKILVIIGFVLFTANLFSQTPQKISYQAVIRNSSGELVKNLPVGIQISILQGSPTGTVIYSENQTPVTNVNALISIEIGGGAGFDAINWSVGPYFIKTETDPAGGTNYTIKGTSQLLSVPYALHAKTAENLAGGNIETDPVFVAAPAKNISSTNITNWNTAFGWGNHASAGYLKSYTETDPEVGANTSGYLPKWDGTALVTGAIYQDASGNIGIGTATPAVKLQLNGSATIDNLTARSILTLASTSGATPYLTFGGTSGGIIQTSQNTLSMRFGSNSTASSVDFEPAKITFRTSGFAGFERLTINAAGDVGIGTQAPTSKLDVSGVITATGGNSTNWNTAFGWGNHATAGYQAAIATGTTSQYWRGDKTWQTMDKSAVGLGAVENTTLSTWTGSAGLTTLGTVTSGIWNAGAITSGGAVTANSIIKTGGTASQFLKADGSVDGNTYITAVREAADEFTAAVSQTGFTLSQTPLAGSKVKMYINGVRISNTACSFTGVSLTYVPANNGSYVLAGGDRVQFDYSY